MSLITLWCQQNVSLRTTAKVINFILNGDKMTGLNPRANAHSTRTNTASDLILSKINWALLTRQVRRETKHREKYQPLIAMYRWWARRPHSLIGSIIKATQHTPDTLISDPFGGGGTVAIEAARNGLRIYSQDLHPWAAWGLKNSLTAVDPLEFQNATNRLLSVLREKTKDKFVSECKQHGASTIINFFRVRRGNCTFCGKSIWLYPFSLVTVASRAQNEKLGYFGCRKCGHISRLELKGKTKSCQKCKTKLPSANLPLLQRHKTICPHCHKENDFSSLWGKTNWELVLVQRLCKAEKHNILHFDLPNTRDKRIATLKRYSPIPNPLRQNISQGRETARLLSAGFRNWADLFPPLQLGVLLQAHKTLMQLGFPQLITERLLLALTSSVEMAGYLCRWDRYHPKIFEAVANHRYSVTTLSVESNLLAPMGRGSLERRFIASIRAAKWFKHNMPAHLPAYKVNLAKTYKNIQIDSRVTVAQGSSHKQYLPSKAVDIILTDPPYFDSIQYAELAEIFLVWMRVFSILKKGTAHDYHHEAVPNQYRGVGSLEFQQILTSVFLESARTLKTNGKLLLTFHNTNLRAWDALGEALSASGFRIVAMAVSPSENSLDHSKRGKQAFVSDLILECKKGTRNTNPVVISTPRNPDQRELVAVGLAIANANNYADVRSNFLRFSKRLRIRKIRAPMLFEQGSSVGLN